MRASVEVLGDGLGIPISLAIRIVEVDASSHIDGLIAAADSSMYEYKTAHRLAREAAGQTGTRSAVAHGRTNEERLRGTA